MIRRILMCVVASAISGTVSGQTLINLATQGRNVDFSKAQATKPVQVGSALPITCSPGQMFFNSAATPGQNLYACTSNNVWTVQSGAQSAYYQHVLSNGISLPQENTIALGSSLQVIDDPTHSSTDIGLASVNNNVGTFGSATQIPVLTVNAFGQITAISTAAFSSGIASGTLAAMPASCSAGTIYLATDQPAEQQLFTCSAANVWTQMLNLGRSGALQIANGSLDINPAVVPQLGVANTFAGSNTMTDGISLLTTNPQPACSNTTRGTLWFLNGGASADSFQVCEYNGSSYTWVLPTGGGVTALSAASSPIPQTDATTSRALATEYQNTSGHSLYVGVTMECDCTGSIMAYSYPTSGSPMRVAQTFHNGYGVNANADYEILFLVPASYYYQVKVDVPETIDQWVEWTVQ